MERTIVPQRIGLECLILNIYEAEWLAGLTTVCLLAASGAPLPLLPYHCSAMCL